MSGREFLAIWASAIGFAAFIVGWAFLVVCVIFPHNIAAAIVLGVGVPVMAMMGGMWLMVRGG